MSLYSCGCPCRWAHCRRLLGRQAATSPAARAGTQSMFDGCAVAFLCVRVLFLVPWQSIRSTVYLSEASTNTVCEWLSSLPAHPLPPSPVAAKSLNRNYHPPPQIRCRPSCKAATGWLSLVISRPLVKGRGSDASVRRLAAGLKCARSLLGGCEETLQERQSLVGFYWASESKAPRTIRHCSY
eukprot:SAG22_NODE_164_length_16817_cov_61.573573_2_plen_183_part_00